VKVSSDPPAASRLESAAASRLKARLRSEAAARRKEAWLRSAGHAATETAARAIDLVAGSGLPRGAAIAGYYPVRYELDCLPLLQTLRASGFVIGLPKTECAPSSLAFRVWTPAVPLVPGPFGLSEPDETAVEVTPELVFVPLLAFDSQGMRLGYGAGYYDAGLASLSRRAKILAVGLAFDEQEFPRLPREPHDVPLDFIGTPTRTLRAEG
jgi:5-formyltetrahydrofolate cyclo-ligase